MSNTAVSDLVKKLHRQEQTSTPGADVLTPKQMLLDARSVEKANPDKRIRWVSLKNAEKMQSRQAEGYSVVPADRGGKRLGDNYVLMEISREKHEARVNRQNNLNQVRLKQHKDEMGQIVEAVARELRDKHGLSVNPERILVQEG